MNKKELDKLIAEGYWRGYKSAKSEQSSEQVIRADKRTSSLSSPQERADENVQAELREQIEAVYNNLNCWIGADKIEDEAKLDREDVDTLLSLFTQLLTTERTKLLAEFESWLVDEEDESDPKAFPEAGSDYSYVRNELRKELRAKVQEMKGKTV